jgi:hypothetical protein
MKSNSDSWHFEVVHMHSCAAVLPDPLASSILLHSQCITPGFMHADQTALIIAWLRVSMISVMPIKASTAVAHHAGLIICQWLLPHHSWHRLKPHLSVACATINVCLVA